MSPSPCRRPAPSSCSHRQSGDRSARVPLALSHAQTYTEDGGSLRLCIVVDTGKVVKVPWDLSAWPSTLRRLDVPLEGRVLVSTARERELCPSFDILAFRYFLVSVLLIDHGRSERFLVVGAHLERISKPKAEATTNLVVQDSINIRNDALCFRRFDSAQQFVLGAPCSFLGSLLVKLAFSLFSCLTGRLGRTRTEIVQVISIVSCTFAGCC